MSITVECACGETFRVKNDRAGRKTRCPACDELVRVPRPGDDDTNQGVTASAPKRKPKPRFEDDDDDDEDDRPRSKRKRSRRRDEEVDDDDNDDEYASDRRRSGRYNEGAWNKQPGAVASISVGVLMMVGAIAWFCAGLFFDFIFFYPPILFFLGVAAVVRGVMNFSKN